MTPPSAAEGGDAVVERPAAAEPASRPELPDDLARGFPIGQAIGWVVLVAFVAWLLWLFLDNPNLDMAVVRHNLFNANILKGLRNTLMFAVCAEIAGLVIGVIVGFGRLSAVRVFRTAAWLYVWVFRSTPLVVQILLWGNLALLLPKLGVGPWHTETNQVMTPFVAGVTALALHEAAYIAEIVRSGVTSVPEGQREAAAALGLSWWVTQRRLILPQALRVMIPPAGSAFVLLLKSTSLVVVISGGDLLTEAQNIASVNMHTIELLLVATLWFLLVTSVAAVGQRYLERRYDRQNRREPVRGPRWPLGHLGRGTSRKAGARA
ncbi:ABC transporter permease subunit [Actinomadura sp. LD22]|uniref:ABC transporter permease subunit n=1 Tax=Actinomadura physcomitrii TaxID=2650748 RepID=A0A6I4MRF9_9ACTN|nr:amino acid ABC transporter permease [Actinomadura physcomitrii]MWA04876.1 ABC transporter permease subunit [Actinomadura physcomitrii]